MPTLEKNIYSYTGFNTEWAFTPSLQNLDLKIIPEPDKTEEVEKESKRNKGEGDGSHYTG